MDAWEIDFGGAEGDAVIECGRCGNEYSVHRIATFHFNSYKVE